MEKRQRTNTVESTPPTQQEAAANIDPLVQPIKDQDGEPVYIRRQSSLFFIPANIIIDSEANASNAKKCINYMGRFSGILYALLASALATSSNFLLKQLKVNILDVFIIRCFVQLLISFGYIIYKGYGFYPESNGLLVLIRSLFAGGGSIAFYYCLSLLPLPDLMTLRYTQVVWTAILVLIIFRERIRLPTIIASILTLMGVICVTQPTFLFPAKNTFNNTIQKTTITTENHQRFFGTIIALFCALSISISVVLNKKLVQKQVLQSLIMLYFLLTTLSMVLIARIYYWGFSTAGRETFDFKKIFLTRDFLLASILTVSQFIPMVLSQKAIKREHPSIITVVNSSDIIFALVLQNIFTTTKTNLLALVGSFLVLTSIFIVGAHKLWLDRQNRTCLPTNVQENAPKDEEIK